MQKAVEWTISLFNAAQSQRNPFTLRSYCFSEASSSFVSVRLSSVGARLSKRVRVRDLCLFAHNGHPLCPPEWCLGFRFTFAV
ncbi:hypothetical protein TNCT_56741 [Trichonephila clavata]|uniref:Uncharacterized protein n=1 Tax=Trichonephila clavata TaxID=2740835 RepID=A0A8X6IKL8_TRICU|nr:hypothetical protein TNCT_56741 [Trichonephila clavata]